MSPELPTPLSPSYPFPSLNPLQLSPDNFASTSASAAVNSPSSSPTSTTSTSLYNRIRRRSQDVTATADLDGGGHYNLKRNSRDMSGALGLGIAAALAGTGTGMGMGMGMGGSGSGSEAGHVPDAGIGGGHYGLRRKSLSGGGDAALLNGNASVISLGLPVVLTMANVLPVDMPMSTGEMQGDEVENENENERGEESGWETDRGQVGTWNGNGMHGRHDRTPDTEDPTPPLSALLGPETVSTPEDLYHPFRPSIHSPSIYSTSTTTNTTITHQRSIPSLTSPTSASTSTSLTATPTKSRTRPPQPPPLLIPSSPRDGAPLFSAYPMVAGPGHGSGSGRKVSPLSEKSRNRAMLVGAGAGHVRSPVSPLQAHGEPPGSVMMTRGQGSTHSGQSYHTPLSRSPNPQDHPDSPRSPRTEYTASRFYAGSDHRNRSPTVGSSSKFILTTPRRHYPLARSASTEKLVRRRSVNAAFTYPHKRRSSAVEGYSGYSTGHGQEVQHDRSKGTPNPLAHTWGVKGKMPMADVVRRRRATWDTLPSPSDEWRGTGTESDQSHTSGGRTDGEMTWPPRFGGSAGWLPPGAMPAVDPSSEPHFQLSAAGQYDMLGRKPSARPGEHMLAPASPPLGVIRVPARRSSLSSDGVPPPIPYGHQQATTPGGSQDPFEYAGTPDARFTLHSISTIAQGKPLVSPAISTRRTSLADNDFFGSKAISGAQSDALGLGSIPLPPLISPSAAFHKVTGSDGTSTAALQGSPQLRNGPLADVFDADQALQMPPLTETSSGAGTMEGLLSSASTSLSRSTKNGKDGLPHGADPVVIVDGSAVVAELSALLEDKVVKRLVRSDKRKYQIVELVETEVAYAEQLRDMVEIYLPQLAALSCITESDHHAIARNLQDMLFFHTQFAARMVEVLKEEHLGNDAAHQSVEDEPTRTERIIRKICAVFLEDASGLEIYPEYCMGAATANDIIREVQNRPEWHSFEKRCRALVATRAHKTLYQILTEDNPAFRTESVPPATVSSMPSRLHLRDLLILPIQRICRYPLVLHNFGAAHSPSPSLERRIDLSKNYDVGVDPDRALVVAELAASRADDASRRSTIRARTQTILRRLEPHPIVHGDLLSDLGQCLLAGGLDVLYHHRIVAPLISPVKVKYMGVFVFSGFLVVVKVKKGIYEVKHYLPLAMCEMVDVTEGFLPYAIRLSMQEHHFDFAAISQQEKDIWADVLCAARETSIHSPFDLPCSVPLGTSKSRRDSSLAAVDRTITPSKRHSMTLFDAVDRNSSAHIHVQRTEDTDPIDEDEPRSPVVPASPMRKASLTTGTRSSILLRRASPIYRMAIDAQLVISEEIGLARKLADQHSGMHSPMTPTSASFRDRLSIRDSAVLKRRRSYVDVQSVKSHRSDSTASGVDYRAHREVGTGTASKRSSIAGSIKRGLSFGSTSDLLSLASPLMSTSDRPFAKPLTPAEEVSSDLTDDAVQKGHRNRLHRAEDTAAGEDDIDNKARAAHAPVAVAPPRQESNSLVMRSMNRKSSLTNMTSLFMRPKAERTQSLPPTPSEVPARPNPPNEASSTEGGSGNGGDSGFTTPSQCSDEGPSVSSFAFGNGYTNLQPASRPTLSTKKSMTFGRFRSMASSYGSSDFDAGAGSRRGSGLETDSGFTSAVSSPRAQLQSVPGSPVSESGLLPPIDGIATSSSRVASGPSTESLTHSSESSGHNPADTGRGGPLRRRSVRFLRLPGFTSISNKTSIPSK